VPSLRIATHFHWNTCKILETYFKLANVLLNRICANLTPKHLVFSQTTEQTTASASNLHQSLKA